MKVSVDRDTLMHCIKFKIRPDMFDEDEKIFVDVGGERLCFAFIGYHSRFVSFNETTIGKMSDGQLFDFYEKCIQQ